MYSCQNVCQAVRDGETWTTEEHFGAVIFCQSLSLLFHFSFFSVMTFAVWTYHFFPPKGLLESTKAGC